MIVFTFSVRNIPPHKTPQEHEAFHNNFLGVNYVRESSSHHPSHVNFLGGRAGSTSTKGGKALYLKEMGGGGLLK